MGWTPKVGEKVILRGWCGAGSRMPLLPEMQAVVGCVATVVMPEDSYAIIGVRCRGNGWLWPAQYVSPMPKVGDKVKLLPLRDPDTCDEARKDYGSVGYIEYVIEHVDETTQKAVVSINGALQSVRQRRWEIDCLKLLDDTVPEKVTAENENGHECDIAPWARRIVY